MRGALLEYLRIMGSLWLIHVAEVAAAGVGAARDWELIPVIPAWIFYVGAVGLFVCANFWAFYTIHREVEQHRAKPRADVSLNAAFNYVFKRATVDPHLSNPVDAVTNMVLERAIAGDLPIFGTRKNPDEGDGVMESIDAGYWRDHSFFLNELHYFKLSPIEKEKRMRSTGDDPIYYNLQTSAAKVFLCWPRNTRLTFQWPFKRETIDVSR